MPFKLLTHFRAFSLKYSLSWRPHAELMTGTLTVRDSLSCIQRVIKQSAQINQILSSPVSYMEKQLLGGQRPPKYQLDNHRP